MTTTTCAVSLYNGTSCRRPATGSYQLTDAAGQPMAEVEPVPACDRHRSDLTGRAALEHVRGLTDDQLAQLRDDRAADPELRLEAATEVGARLQRGRDAAHAAYHGGTVRTGRIGRRRGYRGETVCLDCYYGRPWPGL